jgi:hypothetical protein
MKTGIMFSDKGLGKALKGAAMKITGIIYDDAKG